MGADTIGENALRQTLLSKAGKAKMEERNGGRDWAKGAKAKDMAAKAKERVKERAFMVWIWWAQIHGGLRANGRLGWGAGPPPPPLQ